ncbi:DUF5642 family protein [Mycobacterium sp. MYCO198283]|uniref:DUF5642 family protein n=1 Tax=Mycobacterium sp. MYCO198283 TaxID=2883505 RepID=UPI001E28E3AA|nr:DUF5642 family protein [Mycobacterium sp. MYCO198283]MCG5433723.1 DUF5642 family protein [Mycobacterium sp. MYCO198283]
MFRLTVALALAAATLAACDSAGGTAPPRADVDISRIGLLVNDFPVTYRVRSLPRSTLTREQIDHAAALPAGLTVEPPQCRGLDNVLPDAVGATVEGVEGTGDRSITVVAIATEQPLPVDRPAGCERVTVRSVGGAVLGEVEPIPPPEITGAAAHGYRATLSYGNPPVRTASITFRAQVTDTLAVGVQSTATGPPPSDDGAMERGLLVKAVAAVRGQQTGE